jgi:hypothetical protein
MCPNSRGTEADAIQASGRFAFSGFVTPTAIAAQADDYAPAGLINTTTLRVNLTGPQTMTGIAGGSSGRLLIVYNADPGADTLTLAHNSASSTLGNRFFFSSGAALTLLPGDSITLRYDATSLFWVPADLAQTDFVGATGVLTGIHGLVPAPTLGQQKTILRGSGIWDTVTSLIDTLASMAQGDILYRNATVWTRLAAGTANQFLQTAGSGQNPAWADLGSLVGIQDIAAGATTYTPTTGTKRALVWFCAGGGGGGAADWTSGTTCAAAGGGGAGSQALYRISAVSGTYTITVGGGGAGGVVGVSSGAGANGTDSTFVNGATTVTVKGGVGAVQSAATAGPACFVGGGGGAIATNGSINPGAGDTGQHGVVLSGSLGWGGKGGHCHPFGSGGASRVSQANGIGGVGFGSGGSGGVSTSSDHSGGAGADGRMWIFEFA